MKFRRSDALAAAVVGLAIVLVLSFWLAASCDVPGRRLAMKTAGGVGCFEFWLYRYQSLIAAIVAAAIAAAALRPLYVQARSANAQALSAQAQSAWASARALREQVGRMKRQRTLLGELETALKPAFLARNIAAGGVNERDWPGITVSLKTMVATLDDLSPELEQNRDERDARYETWFDLRLQLQSLRITSNAIAGLTAPSTWAADFSPGMRMAPDMVAAKDGAYQTMFALKANLEEALDATQRQIQHLEAMAKQSFG